MTAQEFKALEVGDVVVDVRSSNRSGEDMTARVISKDESGIELELWNGLRVVADWTQSYLFDICR